MHRAYSFLNVKAVDTEQRAITGTATTPAPDRMGDIVEPLGVQFKNPLPLLLYHDSHKPVGWVKFSKPSKDGIQFEAKLPTVEEPGTVRDRIEEAWTSIKTGLLAGVSIGFRALEYAFNKETGGMHFLKTEVLELSLVAIPAHADARIDTIKSLDIGRPAASGTGRSASSQPPGASGFRTDKSMNASEQITAANAELQTKSARLAELEQSDETNGGLEPDELTEREALAKEVPALNAKLDRLKAIEAAQARLAAPVYQPNGQTQQHARRSVIETPKKEYEKGFIFTRYTMAKAAGRGSYSDTVEYVKRMGWDRETPEVLAYIKAVAGSTVAGSPGWGSELVGDPVSREFVEMFLPKTIIGRLNIPRSPFNTRITVQTGGATIGWVGELGVKPVGEQQYTDITLPFHKVAGIVVLSEELVRFGRPDAEGQVRRDMERQVVKFLDQQFIDPSVSAGTDNPASITNDVTPVAASGTDMDALSKDFDEAIAPFDDGDMGSDDITLVMRPGTARRIGMMRDALGNAAFPGLGPNGGTLFGYPVVTSNGVPAGYIVIIKNGEILLALDDSVRLDSSNQATLDMGGGSNPDYNLWQRNAIGIRAEEFATWKKRRDGAVALISGANYGPTSGSPA